MIQLHVMMFQQVSTGIPQMSGVALKLFKNILGPAQSFWGSLVILLLD